MECYLMKMKTRFGMVVVLFSAKIHDGSAIGLVGILYLEANMPPSKKFILDLCLKVGAKAREGFFDGSRPDSSRARRRS